MSDDATRRASLVNAFAGVVLRPGGTFASLARSPRAGRIGLGAAIVTGLAWAALLALLSLGGHAPSGPILLPVEPERYYAFEAAIAVPVRLAMFAALGAVMHGLARRTATAGPLRATLAVAGLSMAVPSICAWLLPDLIVHLVAGFDALAEAMPYYVPLSLLWTWALAASGLRAVHALGWGPAGAIAAAGLFVHGLVGAPFLR